MINDSVFRQEFFDQKARFGMVVRYVDIEGLADARKALVIYVVDEETVDLAVEQASGYSIVPRVRLRHARDVTAPMPPYCEYHLASPCSPDIQRLILEDVELQEAAGLDPYGDDEPIDPSAAVWIRDDAYAAFLADGAQPPPGPPVAQPGAL